MSDKNLTVKGKYDLASPAQTVELASVLYKHVVSQKLFTPIRGKNYVHIEGWQFAGGMLGLFPRIVEIENMSSGSEIRWKAEAEIVKLSDNTVVSRGFAICSSKEASKKSFDEYAVLSMAQTRAIGKAYRNVIGWVMKLANYEATPAEEMFKMGETPPQVVDRGQVIGPEGKPEYVCSKGAEIISEAEYKYSMKMFKKPLCRQCQSELRPRYAKRS